MRERRLSPLDRLIGHLDQALRTVATDDYRSERPSPAIGHPEPAMSAAERAQAGRLMRVNHAGEIAAQALYQGQALTADSESTRTAMAQAAREENDHLAWTATRIRELGTHTSRLNPVWYAGSFAIGALAGLVGDRWSLGFINETERQVVEHLGGHLDQLPKQDAKSRAILEQMAADEAHHATEALEAGGRPLPYPVTRLMRVTSRVMTRSALWI